MKMIRSVVIALASASAPAAAQLAPGTYEVHAPLAVGTEPTETDLRFVYPGEPLDLSRFPSDVGTVAVGLEEFPQPTACFVFRELQVNVLVLFSAPREQSDGLARIPIPSTDLAQFMLVRGGETGFTGGLSGDVPAAENLVVAHRTGPPALSLCIDAVAQLLTRP